MKSRALLAGFVLFPACLFGHEVGHLGLLHLLGGQGELLTRPWRFEFLPLELPSLHVAGGSTLDPPRRLLFDMGGPLLAAVPLLVGLRLIRDGGLRAAFLANAGILVFFAVIETADYLLDLRPGDGLQFLGWEEFNYGLPALAVLAAASMARPVAELSGPPSLAGESRGRPLAGALPGRRGLFLALFRQPEMGGRGVDAGPHRSRPREQPDPGTA